MLQCCIWTEHACVCSVQSMHVCALRQVFYKVLMGFRPEVPEEMPSGFRAIMEACWDANPDARPSFDVILRCLQARRALCPRFRAPPSHRAASTRGS